MECFNQITNHGIPLYPGEDGEGAVLELGTDGLVGGEDVLLSVESMKINPGGWKNAGGVVEDGDGGSKAGGKDGVRLVKYPAYSIRKLISSELNAALSY